MIQSRGQLLYYFQQLMSEEISLNNLWYKISGAEFGFYTSSEVRSSSVKQITNLNAFDINKVPQKDGLYDPAMGVSPNDRFTVCVTCGQVGLECSGHFGHLELILPVYNPLVMDKLMQLLKLQCMGCHRFRIRNHTIIEYENILKLLRKGALLESQQLEEVFKQQRKLQKLIAKEEKQKEKQMNKVERKGDKGEKGQKGEKDKAEKTDKHQKSKIFKLYQKCLEASTAIRQQLQQEAKTLPLENNSTSFEHQLFNSIMKSFYKQGFVKCPHCSELYKGVKKEGCSKIFGMVGTGKEKRKRSSSTTKGQSQMQEQTNPQEKKQVKKQKYLNPTDIYNSLKALWRKEYRLMDLVFGNGETSNTFEMFFLNLVIVPPNRFRPESKLGDEMFLHDHTVVLTNILKANKNIKHLLITESLDSSMDDKVKKNSYDMKNKMSILEIKASDWFKESYEKLKDKVDFINKCLQLQDYVNIFIDATKASKASDRELKGLRQILEKKEGLFRMKMMGKRVNYAARSVISPDPSLQTNEVGLPVFMAKKLSFPEPVNAYNCEKLKQFIINGKQYPGASFIEQNGTLIKLDVLTEQQRISHARNLLVNAETKVVYRHLMTGDNVLFNRQPTLHKPSLLAHKIRVLPKEQTLRMNYSNCKSYNADFDGDEMNLHALQNYQAKAEAELCITDRIYTNPTNGKPIRELIQDSVIAAVYLCLRDTFLTKSQYSELLYQSTAILFEDKPKNARLFLLQPAIQRPKRLWTGKQLISNVIKIIVSLSSEFKNEPGLNMTSVSCIPPSALCGNAKDESTVRFVDNELVQGMIDKNQIGSGFTFGLVHSFNELYGYKMTGQLQTCLTKLFSNYLQVHGFSCGIDDLILTRKADKNRVSGLQGAHETAVAALGQFLNVKDIPSNIDYLQRQKYLNDKMEFSAKSDANVLNSDMEIVEKLTEKFMSDAKALGDIETEYKIALKTPVEKVTNESLKGFYKRFPNNRFSIMVLTGAKGSTLNHSQVSVMLGQQELEGKRVPMMISGKTLPCFIPYDPNPRAYGFVCDRFLTGLRQQQFYFHCMAGREGLIDTAVKTSRSGYLQRCLMKHLESLKVEYDYTVRDADKGIIQFYFGEDGIDPAKEKFLTEVDFLENNKEPFSLKYRHQHFRKHLKTKQIREFKKSELSQNQTIMNIFPLGRNLVSLSQKAYERVEKFKGKLESKSQKKYFQELYQLKFLNALAHPGECVGCVAAQAVGEPSTQMTLNTFHLAGHGGVNLTLGIPRLRQILMTSTDKLKTPIMELTMKDKITYQQAQKCAAQLQRVKLVSLVESVEVQETKRLVGEKQNVLIPDLRKRLYLVKIIYEDLKLIGKEFNITVDTIHNKVIHSFLPMLLNYIERVHKKAELRTEIKRSTKADKEESGDEIEDEEEGAAGKEKEKEENNEEQIIKDLRESAYFSRIELKENHCSIQLQVPLGMKKFLMTKVIERFLKSTVIREVKGINRAIVVLKEQDAPYTIQTEGVNFKAAQQLPLINSKKISSNDIQTINKVFGIEAARESIVREIVGVFKAYKVTVDHRHLYLIADYMTFPGVIKAMNRNWMRENISPFLKMSFETSCTFLTAAASYREVDRMTTPSSQIAIGQAPTVGTGVFDMYMDMKFQGLDI